MHCPYCKHDETQVLDTRLIDDYCLRRRRRCAKCEKRFSTNEKIERKFPLIVKKNHTRINFDSQKLLKSFVIALNKRPVSMPQIEQTLFRIEEKILLSNVDEIETQMIGQWVMEALRDLDTVAYVRSASVYKSFNDLSEFQALLQEARASNQ